MTSEIRTQELLRLWQPRLLRYAQRFVKAEQAAELVQECFLRLWQAENIEGREREWLFHVCRNLCIDSLRKERRTVLTEEEGVFIPQTEQQLENKETVDALQRLVHALPPAEREVIRLKFQENMDYKEISRVTGHSVSRVGVLIHQGLTAIRKKVKKE